LFDDVTDIDKWCKWEDKEASGLDLQLDDEAITCARTPQ
jgi:hypothetical protein